MRKLLLSGAAIAAITLAVGGPAKAAPPAAFSWTGCYIGGNVGGGWAHKEYATNPSFDIIGSTTNASSLVGGGQVGCDYQAGMWVVGAQGMFDWASMSAQTPFFNGKGFSNRVPWFGSASGRVGYLAQPGLLLFVKAGAAFARDEFKFIRPGAGEHATDATRTGSLVGGGFEWMVAPNWSVVIEYGYMGFGTHAFGFSPIGPASQDIKQHIQVVLVGLNYRFGSWGRP
jgi:outer membrane immunogenic protein